MGRFCAVSRRCDNAFVDVDVRRSSAADSWSTRVRSPKPRCLAGQSGVGRATDHVRLRRPSPSSGSVLRAGGAAEQCRGTPTTAYSRRPVACFPITSRRLLCRRRPGAWHCIPPPWRCRCDSESLLLDEKLASNPALSTPHRTRNRQSDLT